MPQALRYFGICSSALRGFLFIEAASRADRRAWYHHHRLVAFPA